MVKLNYLKYFLIVFTIIQIVKSLNMKDHLIIVFDITSPISSEVNAFRHGVKFLVQSFNKRAYNPISELIFIRFRDDNIQADLSSHVIETNPNEMLKHLDTLEIITDRTDNRLRSLFRCIKNGIELTKKKSLIFVLTVTRAKYKEMALELEKMIQQNTITLYFVSAKDCEQDDLTNQYYDDFATNSKDFVSDADYWETEEHSSNYLKVINLGENIHTKRSPTMKPLITIYDPTGQVSVISDVWFKYGFAVHEPNTIIETSFTPMFGQNNYLAILPTNLSVIHNLESVVFEAKSKSYTYPLRKKNLKDGDLYVTESLKLPRGALKIVLHGTDQENHAIKKILWPITTYRQPVPEKLPKINVQEEQNIYLICKVESLNDITISWLKIGRSTPLRTLGSKQTNTLNHTIEESDITDSGEYICIAENNAGQSQMKIIVDVRRTAINVNTPIKHHTLKVGTRVLVLKCVVTPKASTVNITWLFNGSPKLPLGSIPNLPNLVLNNIDQSFNGTYTCVAQRKTEIKQDNIELNVHYAAKILNILNLSPHTIIDTSKPIELSDESELKILCDNEGNPKPEVKWINQNGDLVSNTSSLIINGNDINHTGDYLCQVENIAGKDKKNIKIKKVIIIIKPKLLEFDSNYRVKLGNRLLLECPLVFVPNNKMDIVWYHNASQIKPNSITKNKVDIDKLDHVHNGKYKCRASNKAGAVEAEFDVKVLYGASILNIMKLDYTGSSILDQSVKNLEIFNLTTLSLTCIVNGNPMPATAWKKNGVIISRTNRIQINSANSGFSATYECSTENEIDSDKRVVGLIEIIKPKLKPYQIAQNLIKDNEFRISCPIEPGNYNVTWYFNDHSFDSYKQNDGSLCIERVYPNMTGRAYCVATNKAGTAVATFNIDVLRPPYGLSTTTPSYNYIIKQIAQNTKQMALVKNDPLEISCHGQGNPTPQIYWLKNDRILTRNKTIVIRSIEPKDAATYTCVAENTLGNQTEKVIIIVYEPPYLLNTTGLEYSTNGNNINKLGITILNNIKVPSTYFKANYEQIITVNEDEKVVLDCNMNGDPRPTVEWFKNNEDLYEHVAVLEFTKVKIDNSGIYKCIGNNDYGQMTVIFYLIVQSIAPQLLMGFDNNYRVKLGNQFSLECPVVYIPNNKMDIVWYHNASRIGPGFILNDRLNIDKLDHVHNGKYKCRASNKAGAVEAEFNVDVLYGASILNILKLDYTGSSILDQSVKNLEIFNLTTLSLTCIVNGNPMPATAWKKNGVIISRTNRIQINSANSGFSATYECSTENEIDSDKRVLGLIEIIKPKLKPYQIAQNLIKDNEFRMSCPIEPGDYNVTWYFNDHSFDSYKQNDGSLFIERVYPNMTGRAYCIATNKAGTAVATFNIDVLLPPYGLSTTTPSYNYIIKQIAQNTKQMALVKNDPLEISCHGQGNPTPQFYWLKNDRLLTRNKTIVIRSIEPKDAATYTCVAENTLGNQTEKVIIIVYEPPYLLNTTGLEYSTNDNNINKLGITILNNIKVPSTYFKANYEQIITVNEDEMVVLDCNMNGDPRPTVEWFKNNENLYKHVAVLEFTKVKIDNSGIYKCIGNNDYGQMTVIFYLIVQSIAPQLLMGFDNNYRVKLGDQFSLECPVVYIPNNKMDIVWYHNASRIGPGFILNDRLNIDKLDHVHNGKYKCRASNKAGAVEAEFNVDVLYGASILNILKLDYTGTSILDHSVKNLEIFNLTTLSLTCIVNGNPMPATAWKKNGVIISRTNRIQINSANSGFSATYECSTENEIDSDKRVVGLIEIIKPQLKPYQIAQNLIKDNEFRMSCPIEPGDYNVTWYFNDHSFDSYKQNDRSLFIERVYPNMTGRAYCIATNKAGTAVATFNIDVLLPPYGLSTTTPSYNYIIKQIAQNTKQMALVKNDPLEISCHGQGNPTPQFYWLKNDRILTRNKTIVIRSIEPKDAATYTCVAENTLGNQTEKVIIIVYEPPYLLNITGLEYSTNGNNINKLGITILNNIKVPSTYFKANYEQIITVNEDEMVVLDCNMNGDPRPTVEWFKNNEDLYEHVAVLEFTKVKIDNSGIYKCIGNNDYGQMTVIFYLIVQSIAPQLLMGFDNNYRVKLGDQFSLECPVVYIPNNKMDIVWYHNASRIGPGFILNDRLNIDKLDHVHNGKYKCRASNKAGAVEAEFNVDVLYGASILNILKLDYTGSSILDQSVKNLEIFNLTTLSLTCIVNGNPMPATAWKKNGVIISRTNRIQINSANSGFSATYECSTENEIDSDKRVVGLIEIIKPQLKPYQIAQNLIKDNEFRMSCPIEPGDYNVTWYFNDHSFDSYKQNDGSLFIERVYPNMTRRAYCVATNKAGTAVATFNIDVLRPPYGLSTTTPSYNYIIKQLAQNTKQMALVKNDPLEISCHGQGNPTPQFYWLKNDRLLTRNKTIVIRSIEPKDAATYTCVAENTLGNQTEKVIIIVYEPPYLLNTTGLEYSTNDNNINKLGITILNNIKVPSTYFKANYEQIITVNEDEMVVLDCNMNGDPRPTVEWFKNNEDLYKHVAVLEFTKVKIDNSGIYKCIGNNDYGQMTVIFYLIVQSIAPQLLMGFDNNYRVKLGDQFSLECPVVYIPNNKMDIVWYHNASRIGPGFILNDRLNIDKLDHVHNGKYKCRASNKAGAVEAEFNVDVLYGASILNILKLDYTGSSILDQSVKNLEIFNLTTLSLTCIVNGNPMPATAWKKNGVIISRTNRIQINSANSGFSATYECSTENEIDSDKRVLGLIEIIKPKLKPYQIAQNLIKDNEFRMSCPIEPGDYNVTWYFNDHSFDSYKQNDGSLFIERVYPNMTGRAYCIATNKAGTAVATFNIDVLLPPYGLSTTTPSYNYIIKQIAQNTKQMALVKNDPLEISCHGQGNPTPQFYWLKNDRILTRNKTIVIRSIEPKDAATYTCVAENTLGNQTEKVIIIVYEPPYLLNTTGLEYSTNGNNINKLGITILNNIKVPSTYFKANYEQIITVNEDEKVVLDCNMNGDPRPTVEWFKNNEDLYEHVAVLEFTKVKIDNSGIYKCIGNNDYGQMTVIFYLIVQSIAPQLLMGFDNNYRVKLGDQFSLECPVVYIPNNKMDIVWYHNASRIGPGFILNDRLNIDKLDHVHNGKYKCRASNKAGAVEAEFNVDVLYGASILNILKLDYTGSSILDQSVKNLEIFNLTTLSLTCIVNGNPMPATAWKKNGVIISRTNRIQINSANSGFSATYECSTENEIDSDKRVLGLIEIIKPKLKPYQIAQNLIKDNEFRISCPIEPGDYNVTWYFNDHSFDSYKQNDGSLFIERVYPNMTGRAYCIATNKAGTAVATFNIDVLLPPYGLSTTTPSYNYIIKQIAQNTKQMALVKNDPLEISCHGQGNPTPQFYWLKNDRILTRNKTIVIRSIEPKDAATYTCVAENTLGNQTEKVIIIVYEPPYLLNTTGLEYSTNGNNINKLGITILNNIKVPSTYFKANYEQIITVNEDEKVVLDCNMNGDPRPTVEWFKNNEDLYEHVAVLEFTKVKIDNSGIYKCIGNNDYGQMTVIFYLIVQSIAPQLLMGFDNNYRVKLGDQFSLECPVVYIPNNKMDIVWYHNASRIGPGFILNDRLNIDKLDHVHNGKYKCRASNKAGAVEAEFNVDVLYGASILNILKLDYTGSSILDQSVKNLEIFNLTTLSLTCIVNGNPMPATAWKKNGVIISRTNRIQINSANSGFSATYECSTENEIDSDKRVLGLIEIIKPKLKPYQIAQNLIKDNEFRISCPIEPGDYNVTWYFNDHSFDSYKQNDGSLFIERVYPNMTGRAYCIATNKAGTAVATFNIDVLLPPYGLSTTTPSYNYIIKQIAQNTKQMALVKNDPLEISCHGQGNPTPQFYWLKNDRLLTRNKTIVIRSIEPKDAATYTCVAENTLGNQTEKVIIIVYEPPYLLNTTGLEYSTNGNNINKLGITILNNIKVPSTYFKANYEQIITVNEDEMVVLDCNMNGDPRPTVEWFKNNENLYKHVAVLEFTKVKIDNSGIYKCIGNNDYGQMTVIFYLIVQSIAPLLLMGFDNNYRVKLGDQFSLECPVVYIPNNKMDIVWYHNASRIGPGFILNDRLNIDKLDHVHNGKYKCRASNKAGAVEAEFNVDVLYGASILNILKLDYTGSSILDQSVKNLEIFNLTTLSLTCIVNGNPMPATAWKKNGVIISRTNRIQINSANSGFSATYECSTENEIDSDKRVLGLIEIIKPKLKPYQIAQNLIKDNEFRMSCPIEPGDYNVTWYFNDHSFDSYKQNDGSLFIERVYPNMTGRAYCIATNKAGTAVATFNIDVLLPPYGLSTTTPSYNYIIKQIAQNTKQMALVKNDPLEISCHGQGNPTPQFYWLKNDRLLTRNKTIVIRSIEPKDAATYTCVAENTLGNQTEKVIIIVYEPPYLLNTTGLEYSTNDNNINKLGITILNNIKVPSTYFKANYEQIITVNEDEMVVLDCNMNGDPRPTVEWFKNNEDLYKHVAVLEFTKVKIDNSGIYKCIGNNDYGQMTVIFYLIVQSIAPQLLMGFDNNYRVKLGDQFSLECPVVYIPNNKMDIVWYHNASRIGPGFILNDRLNIDKLDHVHNGKYKCRASNKAGAVEAEFNVDVLYGASILNILKLDYTGTSILDHSVKNLEIFNLTTLSLTCIVNGNPMPATAWKKNGVIISRTNRIQINSANSGFSATYECSTENEIDSDKRVVGLIEIIKPQLKPYQIAQNLIKDNEFRMSCPIEPGDYNVTWYFNDHSFDSYKQNDGSLFIERVYPNMTGRAYCVATNKAGTAVATFNIDVLRPPYGLSTTTPSYNYIIKQIAQNTKQMALVKNDPLEISCHGQGNPTPQFYWLKNDRLLTRNKTIVIRSIEPKDAATYTCVAENTLGNQTEKVIIIVYEPPYLLNTTGLEYSTNGNNINKLGITILNNIKVPSTYFKANYEQIITVNEDEMVVLDCNMNGDPRPTVEWFKNNEDLYKHVAVLEFTKVKIDNSGIYKCIGNNDYGQMTVIFYLIVQSIAPQLLMGFDNNYRVKLGDQFSLECPVVYIPNNKMDIVWYHNASRIGPGFILNDRLNIDKLDHVHNGKYKCRASNKAGAVEAEFNVDVLYGASILNILKLDYTGSSILDQSVKNLEIFNLTTLSLTCIVNGNPMPATAWKKNGVIISRTNRIQINSANSGFSATYECSTENEIDSDKRVVGLIEIIKPQLKPYQIAQNLIKDNEFRMSCPIEPGDYNVTWFFNDHSFDSYKQNDGSLFIERVYPNMTGRAYCVATNKAGTAVATFNIDVLRPPYGLSTTTPSYNYIIKQIAKNTKQMALVKNDPLEISCHGQGNPTPQIYWLKNDQILTRNKTIVIRSIEPKDAATYTCVAENTLGNQTEKVIIIVYEPPYLLNTTGLEYSTNGNNINKLGITILNNIKVPSTYFKATYEQIITVNEDEMVVLDCNMNGDPRPTVEWFKNNEDLYKHVAVLEFTKVKIDNSGIYKCIGNNDYGQMTVIFYLIVQSIAPQLLMGFDNNYRVKLGDQFSLECPVVYIPNNKMDIVWYHNASRIGPGFILNDRLNIDKLDHVHNGKYKCRASNKAGAVEAEFNVDVLYGASILNILKLDYTGSSILDQSVKNLEIFNLTTLSLTCIVNGNPMPATAWKKNGVIISRTNRIQINSANSGFSATYECSTENEIDSDKRVVGLIEIIKPQLKPYQIAQNLIKDNEFRMSCPIEPGDYNVTWFFNDHSFDSYKQNDGSLFIERVYPNMTGRAYCVATNKAGTAVATFNIDVLRPPYGLSTTTPSYNYIIKQIAKNTKQMALVKNDPLEISCHGQGNPTPQIYWLKNDRILTRNKTIVIRSIEPKDAATYTCVAENTLGNQTEKVIIIVYEPPYLLNTTGLEYSTNGNNINKLGITILNNIKVPSTYFKANYEQIITVNEDEMVVLDCNMNGDPRPTVEWFKNNEDLYKHVAVLEFTKVKIDNSGIYKCIGNNDYGQMTVIFYLIVQSIAPQLLMGFDNNYRVKLGDQFSLECPVVYIPNNKMDIVWYHNASRIGPGFILNDRLNIDKLDHVHNGKYKCRASNKAGAVEAEFNVDVLYGASILNILKLDYTGSSILDQSVKNLEIFNLTTLSLTCIVNGNPMPATAWKKNGVIISRTNRILINSANSGFSATYECSTENEIDSDKRVVGLIEIIKPQLKPYQIAQNLIKDNEFRMSCPIEPGDYNVTWFFNDHSFDSYKQNDGSLFIERVYPNMTGRAYCVATNKAGTAVATFNIDVLRPPYGLSTTTPSYNYIIKQIAQNTKQMALVKNDPLEISCHGQGNPTPQIYWLKNDRILTRNKTIVIRSIEPKDAATYTCVAENTLGNQTEKVIIIVYEPPYLLNTTGLEYSTNGNNINKLGITILNNIKVPSTYFKANYEQIITVNEDEKVVLDCNMNGDPRPTVEWFKNNENLYKHVAVLEFTKVKIDNSGIYKCIGNNDYGQMTVIFYLIVQSIAPQLLMGFDNNYRVKLGDQFSLECPVVYIPNNKMDIVWYHNASRIGPGFILNDRLNIDKLDHVHNGKYKCRANNKAGAVEAEFNVDVLYGASILNILKLDYTGSSILDQSVKNLEIFNLTTLSLTCIVNGNPMPATTWKKNGVIISRTNRIQINSANSGFSATYECSTENEIDSDKRVVGLIEIIKPQLKPYQIAQNLIKDNEFRMSCPIEPGDYNVTWFFNDHSFDSYKQNDGSLFIERVYPNMTGRAYCVATNKAGTAVATFNIDVLRPPYGLSTTTASYKNDILFITPNTKQMALVKNEPLEITCHSQGNPTPQIYWLKNDRLLTRNKTLEIRSIEPKDATAYTCVAENTLGNQTEKINIIVYEPPYLINTTGLDISTNRNNVNKLGITVLNRVRVPNIYFKANYEKFITVNEGENVLLDCNMYGIPRPTINWFKNNNNLKKQINKLEFIRAEIKNSGIYKCVGDNSYGKMAVIYYLNVQKPLKIVSATSTKRIYELGDEINFTCKLKGNHLPVIAWVSSSGAIDNELIFKSNNNDFKNQLFHRDEPIYLDGKNIINLSDINKLERYGILTYEYQQGEFIGVLEYVIKLAKFNDTGQYKCASWKYKVKNSQIDELVNIQVVESPYLEKTDNEYNILQNIDTHKIKCPIKGRPIPSIEWYRGSSIIKSNKNFHIQTNYLEFKRPMANLAGDYSCRGTNNGGSIEFKFKVNIFRHIADISNIVLNRSPKKKIRVEKNQVVVLECSIKVTPIYWSKIIDAYPNKQRQLLKTNTTYNFCANESQVIMCSKDPDPQFGEIYEISILAKPKIQSIEGKVEVNLDDILRLQCDVTGVPKPLIQWYKYVQETPYGIETYPKYEVKNEILIKRRAENSDTTKFVCVARNNLGNDLQIFDVTVLNNSHYYSPWSNWSTCTKTCGEGIQFKTRNCVHASCNRTQLRDERKCNTIQCPIHGGWSKFSPFSQCSKSCVSVKDFANASTKESRRECNSPIPAYGGRNCIGEKVRIINCIVPLCESILNYSGCPVGLIHDYKTGGCLEIDKCKRKGPNSVCRKDYQMCQTKGTDDFECVCRPGFTLKYSKPCSKETVDTKNPDCVDINECTLKPYPCSTMKCINTFGSYKCV